jgi:phosphodiesterase/alkaline phosphatase D-like protein
MIDCSTRRCSCLLLLLLAICLPIKAEFAMQWEGTRPWAGPEVWASPLYDWSVEDGKLVGLASRGRLLQNTVWRVDNPEGEFYLTTEVHLRGLDEVKNKRSVWAGMSVGIKGLMDDQRHILVGPKQRINLGVRGDGVVFLGNTEAEQRVDPTEPLILRLSNNQFGFGLTVFRKNDQAKSDGFAEPAAQVTMKVIPEQLQGNIALAVDGPGQGGGKSEAKAVFVSWTGEGDALTKNASNAFGPILWSQYTRQGNNIKALAMLAPMGKDDAQSVRLEIKVDGQWKTLDTQPIDPLTYSAVFQGKVNDGDVDYRVVYSYLEKHHYWYGRFIADPATTGDSLRIAVFSCDHGYAFPLPTMVENVKKHKPNLVFFAGDQIYENYGGFGVKRTPVKVAMLDYLRKYYQFGWTWRDVLANTPSVIIPDDHDVFQGNIWGAGGRASTDQNGGGYVMDPDWVNGVQRTQTASLPNPVDPTPVEQGIGVYYTQMKWGGLPIAVIEDRKWKSSPKDFTATGRERLDPPGAQLLGPRQEAFLTDWSAKTKDAPLRIILSQTIFCQGTTHAGMQLKPARVVKDTNGWPHSGRQRALAPFKDGKTLMLHGDQHMGLLVRHGIDQHNDGPYAFMVPGTSNGYPRAWWPNGPDGEVSGDFIDPFDNKFSVLSAANPDTGANTIKTRSEGHPEESAHRKGSGYGFVVIDPKTYAMTFNMYRYLFDADNPKESDQFAGFPKTIDVK